MKSCLQAVIPCLVISLAACSKHEEQADKAAEEVRSKKDARPSRGHDPLPDDPIARKNAIVASIKIVSPAQAWQELLDSGLEGRFLVYGQGDLMIRIAKEQGVSATSSMIAATFGPGEARRNYMSIAFGYSNDPPDLVMKTLNSLEDAKDRETVCTGMIWEPRISYQDVGSLDQFTKEVTTLYTAKMAQSIAAAPDREAAAQACVATLQQDLASGKIDQSVLSTFIATVAAGSPSVAWNLVSDSSPVSRYANDQVMRTVVENMAGQSPEKAIALLSSSPAGAKWVDTAFSQWLQKDSREGKEWWTTQGASLPAEQQNAVLKTLAAYDAKEGDLSKAQEWVGKIQDPAVQQEAKAALWQEEQKAVKTAAEEDPQKTLTSLAAGEGGHSPQATQVALSTWLSQDFKAASTWYTANQASLQKDTQPYVAAAFAERYLDDKDPAAAQAWVDSIALPEVRQRLQTRIDQAKPGPGSP